MNQLPFQRTETSEFVDILFTDIRFHVAKPRKPLPLSRAIAKSVRSGRPGRAITTSFSVKECGRFEIAFPTSPELEKMISDAEEKGKTVRFMLPKEGLPIKFGKDAIENIISNLRKEVHQKNA